MWADSQKEKRILPCDIEGATAAKDESYFPILNEELKNTRILKVAV